MGKSPVLQYLPLNNSDDFDNDTEVAAQQKPHSRSRGRFIAFLLLGSCFATSLGVNFFMLYRATLSTCSNAELVGSSYSQLAFDTYSTYHSYSLYWNPLDNQSFSDEAWDALDTNPVAVALSDDYARKHGLSESTRFPWDTERSVYYLRGYHDLHCLKLLHKAVASNARGEDSGISLGHLFHCLDGLRQDVMCTADDTPMPAFKAHHIGDGQIRRCRNWDQMTEWATRLDHNACHKFSDYREVKNTLELFAHCPENSPYFPTMKAYFEIHGHKDLYKEKEEESANDLGR